MISNYAIGARLERLARASLERHGYRVIRSAGSKGAVDLAAFNHEHILLIQVKADRITPADRRKLAAFPAPPGVQRQFWVRTADGWNIYDVAGEAVSGESSEPRTTLDGEQNDEP